MYYRKKRNRGRIITFLSVILLLVTLTFGYISNKNKPIEKPPYVSESDENKKKEIENINESLPSNKIDNVQKKISEEAIQNQSGDDENNVLSKYDLVNKDTEIIFNILYKQTGEIIKNTTKVPITVAGMTLKEFQNYIQNNYSDWKIKSISTKSVALFKEKDGLTPNNYLIQNKDGYIVIYKINDLGEKVLYEETEIPLSVLSEIDKKKLSQGILVKTLDDAMSIIEDYSS